MPLNLKRQIGESIDFRCGDCQSRLTLVDIRQAQAWIGESMSRPVAVLYVDGVEIHILLDQLPSEIQETVVHHVGTQFVRIKLRQDEGRRVSFHIDAPREVVVLRSELIKSSEESGNVTGSNRAAS